MSNSLENIDHRALQVNQSVIIGLSVLGFLFNLWVLPGLTAAFLVLGTLLGRPGFFFLYPLVRKLGVRPDVHPDHPQPHRFAQGFGAVVLTAGTVLVAVGLETAGWVLVGVVAGLAALNVLAGFCAGCFVYYQLGQWTGTGRRPPEGTFPGFKPRSGAEA